MGKDTIVNEENALSIMQEIRIVTAGIKNPDQQAKFRRIHLKKLRTPVANRIKESIISAGGDAATRQLTIGCKVEYTDMLLMGTIAHYKTSMNKLKMQPYGGDAVFDRLSRLL